MDPERSSFKILLFPWLAHGHIFPYLELAKRILNHNNNNNFRMFLSTTPINFSSITAYIQTHKLEASIEVVELQLDPHPDLPPHYHTTKNLPPHLNFTLVKAFQTSKSSFSHIITRLQPHLVIYDVFQPWAARMASSMGIPAVHFNITGAATRAYITHYYIRWDDHFPFPEICPQDHERKSTDELMELLRDVVFEGDRDLILVNYRVSSEFVLLKTSRALEGKYIDYVSSVCKKKILPVGPLVTDIDKTVDQDSGMILQWLSKKEQHSTVYISFGSENFLSKQEIGEMAKGVELSGANFIWVIRFPAMEINKTAAIDEVLPEGFLERVKDRGMVVSGWAPQANILGHPSTGAFLSHCGWSSLNESIYYGVPVIGMPIRLNMFVDAKMLVSAGACVEIVRERNGGFKGEDVAMAIHQVIVDKIMGQGFRRRAAELSEKMRMEEDRATEETVQHLWSLCCKNHTKNQSLN